MSPVDSPLSSGAHRKSSGGETEFTAPLGDKREKAPLKKDFSNTLQVTGSAASFVKPNQ